MPEPDLLQIFARPVHDAGIPYLVAGSVGAMLYSEPRLTLDIDFAVCVLVPKLRLGTRVPAKLCFGGGTLAVATRAPWATELRRQVRSQTEFGNEGANEGAREEVEHG